MTRRMYDEDAYSLGLLYLYKYSNKEQKMALLDDLKKFHQAIENILEENNSKTYNLYKTMWFDNKEGETYCILKPELNIKEVESIYRCNTKRIFTCYTNKRCTKVFRIN